MVLSLTEICACQLWQPFSILAATRGPKWPLAGDKPMINSSLNSLPNPIPAKSSDCGMPVIDVSKAALRLGRKVNAQPRPLATPAPWYRQFAQRQAA
jgi:hypothetical protein